MDTDVSHETEKRLTSLEGRVANLEGDDKPGKPDTEEETVPEEEQEDDGSAPDQPEVS